MNNVVRTKIEPISNVNAYLHSLLIKEYGLSNLQSKMILESHFLPYLKTLRTDLYTVIEVPYVDKMYRDAYYNYYSSKLGDYDRDCIRISFFDAKIKDVDFRSVNRHKNYLTKHYLGFLVIRPTFPKIIGRNALSPLAKKENNIVCCLSKINSTVNSLKFKVNAFPHASQDNQIISCAETTIWALLEYFGNKYPEYKPVLPSTIIRLLHKFSYKRLIPSDGLTAEQVTYTVRELGFGSMIYSRKKYDTEFDSIVSTYIESGIPVIGVLQNGSKGHAINIVGRVKDEPNKIVNSKEFKDLKKAGNIIDYNKLKRNYVFIDDNYPPYQISELDKPCKGYYSDTNWHDCDITNIIVPLYHKIYLDATRARRNFNKVMENEVIGIKEKDKKPRVLKTFLSSSRSYKEYIALNKEMNEDLKELLLSVPMPKFIWVAELSKIKNFKEGKCDGILIQDATEPVEYTDKSMLSNLSIITGCIDGQYFRQHFGKFQTINTFAQPFETFKGNLK